MFAATTACGGPDYQSLRVGQCLPESAEVVGTREPDPPTVPCDEAHRYEVYAVSTLDGGRTFPGTEAVDAAARQRCYELFESNVGFDPADMPDGVRVVYLDPTESSWEQAADRDVECLLIFDDDRDQQMMTPSDETTGTNQEGPTT